MNRKIIGIVICTLLIVTALPTVGIVNQEDLVTNSSARQERDFGDAPEGDNAIAYPSLGVLGSVSYLQNYWTCRMGTT